MVSTNEDPNGNLANYFGGLQNGLTGDSGGYRHDYVDLTPYAGTTILLRLRCATDAAFTGARLVRRRLLGHRGRRRRCGPTTSRAA